MPRGTQQVAHRTPTRYVGGRSPRAANNRSMPANRRMRSRSSVAAATNLEPDRDARRPHALLGLAHRVLPVVEDRGAQHGVGASLGHGLHEVVKCAAPPLAITGTSTAPATALVSSIS